MLEAVGINGCVNSEWVKSLFFSPFLEKAYVGEWDMHIVGEV